MYVYSTLTIKAAVANEQILYISITLELLTVIDDFIHLDKEERYIADIYNTHTHKVYI